MSFAAPINAPYRTNLMPQTCLYANEHVRRLLLRGKLDNVHKSGQQRTCFEFRQIISEMIQLTSRPVQVTEPALVCELCEGNSILVSVAMPDQDRS